MKKRADWDRCSGKARWMVSILLSRLSRAGLAREIDKRSNSGR